jgi:ABC-type multidrug transport system fused ATPase/permease subunit
VGAKFLQPLSRSLHFDAVTYRTPSQKLLLDRLTLKLDAGKSYAVVSLDPMEAKAFALLLPRFLEPQSGRVLFDGEDIAWATLESLRAEAVFVGGDDPPLRGTVLDNLRAGNPQFALPQVTEAAKQTHAHNFLVRLPQGYETVLTGDDELDPSQRFRLSLTRAILRNPALLIIEEPKVPLDEDTKQLLDDAYQRLLPGRTVIFLPSRLTTLKRVDEVILLHHGQVAAQGPQSELVNESPLYRHWEYLHFNEFRHSEALAAQR